MMGHFSSSRSEVNSILSEQERGNAAWMFSWSHFCIWEVWVWWWLTDTWVCSARMNSGEVLRSFKRRRIGWRFSINVSRVCIWINPQGTNLHHPLHPHEYSKYSRMYILRTICHTWMLVEASWQSDFILHPYKIFSPLYFLQDVINMIVQMDKWAIAGQCCEAPESQTP